MGDARWQRLTGWMGISAAVLLTVAGMLSSRTRQYDASAAETASYYMRNSGQVLVALDLQLINMLPFLLFLIGLRTFLVRIEVDPAPLSTLAFAAGVVLVPVLVVWHAMPAAAALASPSGDLGSIRPLLRLGSVLDAFATMPAGILVIAASLVMLRGVMPRWLPWLGLVDGALLVVGSLNVLHPEGIVSSVGHVGFLGFVVWVLATSITMIRASQAPRGRQSHMPADKVGAM